MDPKHSYEQDQKENHIYYFQKEKEAFSALLEDRYYNP